MRAVLASLLIFGMTGIAAAQEADRYALEKKDDAFVRLDKRSGEISTCTDQSGQLVCRLAADDRTAFEDEIDRLRDQINGLEKRVTALEQGGTARKALPSDEEFDRTMSYMQRFFRGFLEIVKEFDRDLRGGDQSGDTAPNKT